MISWSERSGRTPIEASLKISLHRSPPTPDCRAGVRGGTDMVLGIAKNAGSIRLKPAAERSPFGVARIVQTVRQKIKPGRGVAFFHRGMRVGRGPRARGVE